MSLRKDKMRTFLYRFIGFIVVLFIVCGLLIALLPTLASTHWGRNQIIYWVNRSIPGNFEIQHLDLHWGRGQVLEGILLKDPEGQSVLGIEKISTDATLWQLLRKSTHLGFTQIQDFNAAIVTDEKGWTNLQRALGTPPSDDTPPLSPSTIILSDVNADFYLFAQQHPLSAWIKGLTKQENLNGSFEINLSLEGIEASNWKKLKKDAHHYLSIEGSKEAKLQARIVNFPVDLIDRLIALRNPNLNGLFHSLLGDRLDLTIDKKPSHEGLAFNLTTLAPLMQGEIKGKVINGVLTLQEPAVFNFNLNPELVNPFTHDQFELLSYSRLQILFPTLSLPLNFFDNNATVDPCLFGFKAEFKLPETEVEVNQTGKINIRSLQVQLDSPLCDKSIQLQVVGQAQQGKESFAVHFDSILNKPINSYSLLQQMHQGFSKATLKISHLPLQLIPSLEDHPEWIEQIGSYADAKLILNSNGKKEWDGTLSLQTDRLSLKEAQFRIGNEIVLTSPAQFIWSGTKDCLHTFLKTSELILDQPCLLQFTLNQFQSPLDNPNLTKYQFESIIPHLQFSKLLTAGTLHIDDLTLKIDGQNLTHFNSQLKGQVELLTAEGLEFTLFKPLQFDQTSHWEIGSDGKIEMPLGQLQLTNSITHIQGEARLTSNHELELTQPVKIQYILTPHTLQPLYQTLATEWPMLQQETPIRLTIDPTSFNLNSLTLSSLQIQGMLGIDHLILSDPSGAVTKLEEIVMPWVIDAPQNDFYADLKGLVYAQENVKSGHISAHMQIWPQKGHFDSAHAQAEIHMNFAGMPTSLINIISTKHDLSPVLGSNIDFDFKAFFDPFKEKQGYLEVTVNSSHLHASGRFKLNGMATISNPAKLPTIRLKITPESYQYLKQIIGLQDEQKLASSFTLSGYFSQLDLPLKESLSDHGQLDFKFSTTDIQWQNTSISPIRLEGHASSENFLEQILFSAQAISSSPILILQGTLTNVFDPPIKLRNWQEMGLKAKIQGQQLTPHILQSLFLFNHDHTQKLKALFGESFEVNADCQLQNLNGPVQASAIGTQGEIHLDGHLKQGILMLNRPLEGSVKMTPLLSQAFLAKNVPILSTAIGAENSIKFKIEENQFSCPLIPFKLDQVKIGKGLLDLGKIQLRNEGELSSLLSIIRSISDPYLTIWFTPLYFQLDKGILALKRFDMLIANSYILASWGDINLNQHKGDLVLGLSAQSLQYAFGIQGLDEQYILQIPLHSVNGKVEIDKKKAAGRITSLIAKAQMGSQGKILGNLLDLALSNHSENTPPPTTQPFPWKGEFTPAPSSKNKESSSKSDSADIPSPTKENQEGKKKRKHHRESDDQIKNLKQDAVQILDQLFGQ